MAVESASYISQLNTSNPAASDNISEGDDHLRLIKTVLQTQNFLGLMPLQLLKLLVTRLK